MSLWQDFKAMDNKKKAIYIALAVLILLLLLLGGYYLNKLRKVPVSQPPINQPAVNANTNQAPIPPSINPINLQQEINAQSQERDIRIIAEPFLERFGSYNNQDNFANMQEIQVFMTSSLSQWVNSTYLPKLKSEMPPINEYYSINTKVLSSSVELLDQVKGKATITMSTQRQEITNGAQTRLYYQDARVELERVGSEWKINGVFWL